MRIFQKWELRKKSDTPKSKPRVIPELEKPQKSDIIMERNVPRKYNTSLSTKRVNHVTRFKTAPNMFKIDAEGKITTRIGTDYLSRIYPKKDTIAVEPLANHINCKTTRKILGYRDLVKMDALVCTNSVCNKLGSLSQGWGKHAGTNKI